jgi:PAS domain S-box-containing protein
MGVSLRHEGQFYGAMWVAYDQAHTFSEEEVRFLVTLAGQAAIAAANARLFLNAEIGRQRLSAILASTPDPVLVTDQQNRLLLANPAVWRVLGMGGEWDEGKPIEDVISQKELLELLDMKAQDKRSLEITMPDNRVYFATATSVVAEGHRVGRVCVLRDITGFKELDALKSEFVNTVSHDLRSPLTLVRGYASMLEIVGDLNEQQNTYLRKMISSADDMSHLVSDILDLGRIEAGIGLKVARVPVREVVDHVVSALQLEAAQRKVQLTAEISPQSSPWIEADQALLQQALYNLVDNGIKNTEANGSVKIRIEPRQDMTQFIVSDTGVGISTLDQPRIFEKFFRSTSPSNKKQQGTGLGLAIVKSIADRHGGSVTVSSILGKGSVFTLAIPTRRAAPVDEQAALSAGS